MGTRDINSFGTKGNGERLYDDSVTMEKGFPVLGFSRDYCLENHCDTLYMCACTFSRSELVKFCYMFFFDINLIFSVNNLIK